MSYIVFNKVNKYFGSNHVLKDISLEIEEKELITLLGPSGCGKSTLLRCLAGLEATNSGKIYIDGKDVTDLQARKRNVGMVFQQYSLFPNMNVYQNVAFGLKIAKRPAAAGRACTRVGDLAKGSTARRAVVCNRRPVAQKSSLGNSQDPKRSRHHHDFCYPRSG